MNGVTCHFCKLLIKMTLGWTGLRHNMIQHEKSMAQHDHEIVVVGWAHATFIWEKKNTARHDRTWNDRHNTLNCVKLGLGLGLGIGMKAPSNRHESPWSWTVSRLSFWNCWPDRTLHETSGLGMDWGPFKHKAHGLSPKFGPTKTIFNYSLLLLPFLFTCYVFLLGYYR